MGNSQPSEPDRQRELDEFREALAKASEPWWHEPPAPNHRELVGCPECAGAGGTASFQDAGLKCSTCKNKGEVPRRVAERYTHKAEPEDKQARQDREYWEAATERQTLRWQHQSRLERIRRLVAEKHEVEPVGSLAKDRLQRAPEQVDAMVPGFIIPGWVTKLAGREKLGKGTLVYYLMGCLERSDETVFGDGWYAPVDSIVLTEEPDESINEKLRLFGVSRARIVQLHEVLGMEWHERIDKLVTIALYERRSLIFIDNVSEALDVEDESGKELSRKLARLSAFCQRHRLAGLVDHHHKQSGGKLEDRSRGNTSIAGKTDINVEMVQDGPHDSRKRYLRATGRVAATCWEENIELSEDGTDYTVVAPTAAMDPAEAKLSSTLFKLQSIHHRRREPISIKEFAEEAGMAYETARRKLQILVDEGHAVCLDDTYKDAMGRTKKRKMYRPV